MNAPRIGAAGGRTQWQRSDSICTSALGMSSSLPCAAAPLRTCARAAARARRSSRLACASASEGWRAPEPPAPLPTLSSRAASASGVEALALPGRVALGALLSLPGALSTADPAQLARRASSLSWQALLANADVELAALAQKGVEAEEALRAVLPPQLAALLPPPPVPLPPRAPNPMGATYSPGPPVVSARFEGGVGVNRAGSEAERLLGSISQLRQTLAAARTDGGALKVLAARRAKESLQRQLSELSEDGAEGVSPPEDAATLSQVLQEARQLSEALRALAL